MCVGGRTAEKDGPTKLMSKPVYIEIISSIECRSRSGRVFSGRPSRTARTPLLISPSRMLSTAMFESEHARIPLNFRV